MKRCKVWIDNTINICVHSIYTHAIDMSDCQVCTVCGRNLPLESFSKGNSPNGRDYRCKECYSAYQKNWLSSKPKPYFVWKGMMSRCYAKGDKEYPIYGGRGIKVCDEWKNSKNFCKWAENSGYAEDLCLDRVDNDKDYCPENCKWSTYIEQENNRRNNRHVIWDGERMTVAQFARKRGKSYTASYNFAKRRGLFDD